jgi:chemotaxis protein MotA
MDLAALFDAPSAAIVLGGTLVATVLRCGLGNCATAIRALAALGRAGFDADATRAEMAVQVREIEQDGVLRARPRATGDAEIDEATGALFGTRSVKALLAAHESHKARRMDLARRASGTLAQAAELAPVFGLAGTLLSLTQLPTDGLARGAYAGAISMAVLTTLYGLLLANIVLAPLARAVDRAAQAEEAARQQVIDWLAAHLERSLPRIRPVAAPGSAEDRAA